MSTVRTHRISAINEPTIPASVLALLFAALAHGLVLQPGTERRALGAAVVGIGLLATGYEAWQRRHRLLGVMTAVGGSGLVAVGLLQATGAGGDVGRRLVVLTGIIGIVLLGCALIPPLGRYARPGVVLGAGLVLVSILSSGILESSSLLVMLVATAATIAAWDMGDHAITLGRQVGRTAPTGRVTLLHLGGTLMVAVLLLIATIAITSVVQVGLSVGALLLLLVSCSALLFALHH